MGTIRVYQGVLYKIQHVLSLCLIFFHHRRKNVKWHRTGYTNKDYVQVDQWEFVIMEPLPDACSTLYVDFKEREGTTERQMNWFQSSSGSNYLFNERKNTVILSLTNIFLFIKCNQEQTHGTEVNRGLKSITFFIIMQFFTVTMFRMNRGLLVVCYLKLVTEAG